MAEKFINMADCFICKKRVKVGDGVRRIVAVDISTEEKSTVCIFCMGCARKLKERLNKASINE